MNLNKMIWLGCHTPDGYANRKDIFDTFFIWHIFYGPGLAATRGERKDIMKLFWLSYRMLSVYWLGYGSVCEVVLK